jgi:signal transduction histidine kinase
VVRADPDRIQQVILNLLRNAVKFTPSGGAIEIELSWDGGAVQIMVRDNGISFRPDFLPLVFDRFKQGGGHADQRRSVAPLTTPYGRWLKTSAMGTAAAGTACR